MIKAKLEKVFHLSENHTDIKTEFIAGCTTFMTMSYILAVNPSILSEAGMDKGAVFTATILAAFIGTMLMAVLSNYPIALAPGMGLNAYFAYTVVLEMGYTWQVALAAVFVEGVIFIILSLTNVREVIFNAIPPGLKNAASVGVGIYIAFIGLQNAKIIVDGNKLVAFYSFHKSVEEGRFSQEGITVLLALLGIIITSILVIKKVKGNILWGILITWGLGIVCELTGLYKPQGEFVSLLPDFSRGLYIPSLKPTFMQMDFSKVFTFDFMVVMAAFLFVDMFDTIGALIGITARADLLDANGKLPRVKGALTADAIATFSGAVLGTSTTTTYIESASGRRRWKDRVDSGYDSSIIYCSVVLITNLFGGSRICYGSCINCCWLFDDDGIEKD